MSYHSYGCLELILARIFGTICLIIGLFLSLVLVVGLSRNLFYLAVKSEAMNLDGVFPIALLAVLCLGLGTISSHAFPDLACDDKGLYVRFYFKWLFVPWEDVISFRESLVSTVDPFSYGKHRFVLIRKGLTPLHWIVSLNQALVWGPGFLIAPKEISDYHDLARAIKEHLDQAAR